MATFITTLLAGWMFVLPRLAHYVVHQAHTRLPATSQPGKKSTTALLYKLSSAFIRHTSRVRVLRTQQLSSPFWIASFPVCFILSLPPFNVVTVDSWSEMYGQLSGPMALLKHSSLTLLGSAIETSPVSKSVSWGWMYLFWAVGFAYIFHIAEAGVPSAAVVTLTVLAMLAGRQLSKLLVSLAAGHAAGTRKRLDGWRSGKAKQA